jgi:hypothetical protein
MPMTVGKSRMYSDRKFGFLYHGIGSSNAMRWMMLSEPTVEGGILDDWSSGGRKIDYVILCGKTGEDQQLRKQLRDDRRAAQDLEKRTTTRQEVIAMTSEQPA